MRIEFEKIRIRDFKEYRGKHVFPIGALGLGLHYMRGRNEVDALGSNGAAKSTIWDAFMWCLTGYTTRGLRGTDVRTWGGEEHADVSVSFWRDDDGHVIRRSTKTNGLWLDGKLTSQEEIERLISLNADTIPHTILLPQKRELFFDLKPAGKLSVLSDVLGLDRWEQRSKKARDAVKDLEKVETSLAGHIRVTQDIEERTRDALEKMRDKSREWEAERSKGAGKREDEIARLKKARTKLENAMGYHDLAYDGAETELRAIRRDIIKKQEALDEIIDKLQDARVKRDARKKDYDDLKALATSDTCPTCGQSIEDHRFHAKEAKARLKDAKHKWQISSDRVIVRETQKEMLRDVITRMHDDEKGFASKSDDAKDKFDQHKARMADIDQQIAVLKAKDRTDETNPYEESIRAQRETIKKGREFIRETQEKLDRLSRKITRTRYWIDGFKLVRLYLLQDVLEELEEVTNNMLPDMGLEGWAVAYDIEREKKDGSVATGLNVSILKPGMRKPVKWEAWSGGENQRLLIIGALALSEVLLRNAGVECDLIVLDEPTRHMSPEGITNVVDHLIDLGKTKSVFYVDHQAIENSRFASVITVVKDEDGARIEI